MSAYLDEAAANGQTIKYIIETPRSCFVRRAYRACGKPVRERFLGPRRDVVSDTKFVVTSFPSEFREVYGNAGQRGGYYSHC